MNGLGERLISREADQLNGLGNRLRVHLRFRFLVKGVGWGVLGLRSMSSMGIVVLLAACAGPQSYESDPADVDAPSARSAARVSSRPRPAPTLSPEARRVSQIASRNGDRDFLMLDKIRGKIIIFKNGGPTFSGSALTGENPADRLPPDAIGKTFAEQKGLKYKVTPAGRYTVSSGYDHQLGEILDVNEIKGKDWDIAIHKVWLGAPAEHRDARLRSPKDRDKHITYGCIDVDESTMRQLLERLPNDDETPLYILPMDQSLVMKIFQPRDAARKTPPNSG